MADPVGSELPSTQATDTSAPLPDVQAANLNPSAANTAGGGSDTGTYNYNPNWDNPSWLSTIGSDLSGAAKTAGNWLNSPTGQNVMSALPIGAALYEQGRANTNAVNLTNAITGAARPQLNLGNATVGQLQGQGNVGGPMGQYISGATGAANTLANTAQQYATGQLTPAQQQQVQQYANAAKSQVASQFSRGNLDSSARMTSNEAIDNNAAMLAQNLVAGNLQMSAGALNAVNQTYSTLLTNALNQAGLGTDATAKAVQLQLQNNQQLQQLMQQIFSGIAQQMTTAQGGKVAAQGGNQAQTPGQQLGAAGGQLLQKLLGTGGTPTTGAGSDFATQQANEVANYLQGSGATAPGITDIANAPMPNFNIDTSSIPNPDPSTMGLGSEGW